MNNNYAYITLLSSEEYIFGTVILNKSLQKVKSKYPLIVCLTNNLSNNIKIINILNEEKINYFIVKKLQYNNDFLEETIPNTASKIQIFQFQQFDKLIYIDSDVLILKNIDNLFNYPNGSILQWPNPSNNIENISMSGLFVFIPRYQPYNIYEFLITHMNDITDGMMIEQLFFSSKDNSSYQIPKEYLIQDKAIQPSYKAIHYEVKPFLLKTTKERLQYYKYPSYKKYFDEYLIPFEQKYKKYLIK